MNQENHTIDRHVLVTRHNIELTALDPRCPLQVGNGEFAFNADITGLQTFHAFNTLSHWGWHSAPLPRGQKPEHFHGEVWDTHGRPVAYPIGTAEQAELADWLFANPHRLNLGRIGLRMTMADGRAVQLDDLKATRQRLDLWNGLLTSCFEVENQPVQVETCVHPVLDALAVRIKSPLIKAGRMGVMFEFPYGDMRSVTDLVGDWDKPDAHFTTLTPRGANRGDFVRKLNADEYHLGVVWGTAGKLLGTGEAGDKHRYTLRPGSADGFDFVCAFAPRRLPDTLPGVAETIAACRAHWNAFWNSGGAVDLSESADPRAHELERRIVLSQYITAINCAGSLPPQESGLFNNGWHGKFHLEMYGWHGAHFALWDRWPLLERSLGVYGRFLSAACATAVQQGYRGARWPKMIGPEGRPSPHIIHAFLIWQQPHPIFFAELDYRRHPARETLEKWREIVFATADFMASYAFLNEKTGRYDLGPPLHVVSENVDPALARNPAFELSYWRFGLRVAQLWRERLGLPRDAGWDQVRDNLAPLPVEEGMYVLYEGVTDMWTKWNWEHPALIGVRGLLPGDGADEATAHRTLRKVFDVWQWDRVWGWDFPMTAMAAARLGEPEIALDLLLKPECLPNGVMIGNPHPYLPTNGGLLYAVALMAAGWDGAPGQAAPGFPNNGQWRVRQAGLKVAP